MYLWSHFRLNTDSSLMLAHDHAQSFLLHEDQIAGNFVKRQRDTREE